MNNNNSYNPYTKEKIDPNKKKKCSCEDKYGPKPFNSENTQKNNATK